MRRAQSEAAADSAGSLLLKWHQVGRRDPQQPG